MRSKLLFLGAGFVCALLACDAIIGLDKVKKCDDAELVCGPLDASDAGIDASDAQTSDVFVIPDGASEASSWPLWRMDNTPTEVQQGAADASRADFDASSGAVITDGVTKLTWKASLGFAGTIDDAVAYCKSINGRLPTRIELVTILDSTRKGSGKPYAAPAFDAVLISDGGSFPQAVWSSSYSRPVLDPLHYWFADLATGDMLVQQPFSGTGVLCLQ